MNIGVFSTHVLWPTHYETELDIISKLINLDDKIYHFTCDKALPLCEIILENSLSNGLPFDRIKADVCNQCVQKKNKGRSLLSRITSEIPLIDSIDLSSTESLSDFYFENHENIKKLYVDNYDVGWSILSSMISYTRDPFLDLKKHKHEINILYHVCIKVYHKTLSLIDTLSLDKGYVFNGRFSYTRAILRAFQKSKKPCYTHERGSSLIKFSLFENHTIHDIEKTTKLILDNWETTADSETKIKLAKRFFIDRAAGKMESWKSFTENQHKDKLPEKWSCDDYNIVVFTSSEDEFISIGNDWQNPIYENQLDGLEQISTEFKKIKKNYIKLYIRMHPNSAEISPEYLKKIYALINRNVIVIPPNSTVSTYSLIKNASKIVSFGSTVGIEAVFWNKVSILLGRCLYYNLKGPYKPMTHEEVMEMLFNKNLIPMHDHEALKYGYFFKSFGVDYANYVPKDFMSGLYKGIDLNSLAISEHIESNKYSIVRSIAKWFQ